MIKNDIINFSKGWNNVSDISKQERQDAYRGEVGKVLLGQAVSKNDLLYPVLSALGTVAEWKKTDASAVSTMGAQAIALEDGSDETYIKVMFKGYIKDKDFSYSTEATGTIVQAAIVAEGDRVVLGLGSDEKCFQFTAAKGTTSAARIAAVNSLTTTGVAVEGETLTIDDVVFEFRTDDTLTAGSDYVIDVSTGLTQAIWEPALETAMDNAIDRGDLRITYVTAASNIIVMTVAAALKGLDQNAVTSDASGVTNASFTQDTTFLGGCPAVDFWVLDVATEATQKTLFMAQLDLAIADNLPISYVDFTGGGANDNLVMTSTLKGYEGNSIQMYECDDDGALDAGTNITVSATKMSGGVEGGILYASESAGLLTLTKPSTVGGAAVVQQVGHALEAEKFFFNPQPPQMFAGASNQIASPFASGVTSTGGADPEVYQYLDAEGQLITDIFIDVTSLVPKGESARDVIGTAAASYLFKNTLATYGYIHTIEMTCLELPVGAGTTVDIDLEEESSGTLQTDGACSDTVLIASSGWSLGKMVRANVDLTTDYYVYLTEGDTNGDDSAFTAGQFRIKLIAANVVYGR